MFELRCFAQRPASGGAARNHAYVSGRQPFPSRSLPVPFSSTRRTTTVADPLELSLSLTRRIARLGVGHFWQTNPSRFEFGSLRFCGSFEIVLRDRHSHRILGREGWCHLYVRSRAGSLLYTLTLLYVRACAQHDFITFFILTTARTHFFPPLSPSSPISDAVTNPPIAVLGFPVSSSLDPLLLVPYPHALSPVCLHP